MKLVAVLLLLASGVSADAPEVENVIAEQLPDGAWRFDVTISHPDTGWDHYADGWRVEDETGGVLGLRVLAHPHEAEQPFTRALSGVALIKGTDRVFIRTRCIVDGWSDHVFELAPE